MGYFSASAVDGRSSVDRPFLSDESGERVIEQVDERKIARLKRAIVAFGVVIVVLVVICFALVVRLQYSTPIFPGQVYSPAMDVIRHKNVVFTSGFGSERTAYQGPPTPERDALWDDLYSFGISRIPRESAAKLVNKTVPLPGSKGSYVVELNIFHQLHCLNMLRKRLYSKQDYAPDHELMGIEHLEHCYDALRQSLMCSADITPLPWQWVEAAQESKEVAQVAHTCRDFDAIKTWAKEREVVHFDRKTYVPDDLDA
ncbi:uncharacterized protein DCS_03496 [Drechmeria coniospora]|uniref:Tat pathway signal sequence n=1 Tax=Drechmeria coniospora TaxID=98403 RepID=A0A151GHD7_DRECN|nr:uncharacterized protein DCS_03496 [Drechmeria coniospora]KYK56496.1 uncharacterized protein DCS_03496 [Drechmeria coniospora]